MLRLAPPWKTKVKLCLTRWREKEARNEVEEEKANRCVTRDILRHSHGRFPPSHNTRTRSAPDKRERDPSVCSLWLVPTDIPSEVIGYISSSFFLFTILLSKWLNQINPARELFNAFQSTGLLSFGFRNSDLFLHLITYFPFHPQELECLHLLGRRRWRFLTEIFTPLTCKGAPSKVIIYLLRVSFSSFTTILSPPVGRCG